MDKHTPEINGALLRMRREELGWALPDLATRACLSNKQVKQIEEGGTSSFYSESVKVTAAKKVGGILGLPEQSIFVMDIPELDETQEHEPHSAHPTVGDEAHVETASDSTLDKAHDAPDAGQTVSQDEQKEIASSAAKPYLKSPSIETTVIQKSTNSALDSEDKPKSKNSLWYIIALFVAALGLAAVMQQPASTPSAEPPPPIQVLPADQADPARICTDRCRFWRCALCYCHSFSSACSNFCCIGFVYGTRSSLIGRRTSTPRPAAEYSNFIGYTKYSSAFSFSSACSPHRHSRTACSAFG
jgi:transcriptional regulator with XRE-family HTH domain